MRRAWKRTIWLIAGSSRPKTKTEWVLVWFVRVVGGWLSLGALTLHAATQTYPWNFDLVEWDD